MNRRLVSIVALSVLVVLATSCSSSKRLDSGRPTTAPLDSSTTSPDTAPVDTEAATSTSSSVASTTVAPEPLVLLSNGIGPFNLGDGADEVVAGLTERLGTAASDVTAEYPDDDGFGGYQTVDGEFGFIAPFGRSVCWAVGFCTDFGGASSASASFTGWSYSDDTTGALRSTSNVTVGTSWADVPTIAVDVGGCYSVGSGSIDGIRLSLTSTGVPFGGFDDLGNYITNVPAAGDVSVTQMETGKVPASLFGDC